MKSQKRLLVGALVSATLCQSGASALPVAGKISIGVGVGASLTVAGLIGGLAYRNSKKDAFQDALDASYKYFDDKYSDKFCEKILGKQDVNPLRGFIVQEIGEKAYSYLCNLVSKYFKEGKISDRGGIVSLVHSLNYKVCNWEEIRFDNPEKAKNFFNNSLNTMFTSRKYDSEFVLEEVISECLAPIMGNLKIPEKSKFYSKAESDGFGNAFGHYREKVNDYGFKVDRSAWYTISASDQFIKLEFFDGGFWRGGKASCVVILDMNKQL